MRKHLYFTSDMRHGRVAGLGARAARGVLAAGQVPLVRPPSFGAVTETLLGQTQTPPGGGVPRRDVGGLAKEARRGGQAAPKQGALGAAHQLTIEEQLLVALTEQLLVAQKRFGM